MLGYVVLRYWYVALVSIWPGGYFYIEITGSGFFKNFIYPI